MHQLAVIGPKPSPKRAWPRLIAVGVLGILWTMFVSVLSLANESNESNTSAELFFLSGFLVVAALAYVVMRRATRGRRRSLLTAVAINPATYLLLVDAVVSFIR